MNQGNSHFATSFFKLHYEVMETTSALMTLLQGLELARTTQDQTGATEHGENERSRSIPDIPYLNATIGVEIPRSKSTGVASHTSLAEQLAFKGWVEQVFNIIWERQFRGDSYKSLQLPDDLEGKATLHKIRPKMDVAGDLRRIRNDLVHTGVASVGETGKCKILDWFKPGDPMVFSTNHVFDFLNQMGFMNSRPVSDTEGSVARLLFRPTLDEISLDSPAKRIISVRQWTDHPEDGSERHLTSTVFEDGIHIHKADDVPPETPLAKGDVDHNLYREAAAILLGHQTSDVRISSPWIAFSNFAD